MLFPRSRIPKLGCNYATIVCREFSLALKFLFTDRTLVESPPSSSPPQDGVIIGVKYMAPGSRHLCAGIIPVHAESRPEK